MRRKRSPSRFVWTLALVGALGLSVLTWAPRQASAQNTSAHDREEDTPKVRLRDAENSYLYGDYVRVVARLTPVMEPSVQFPNTDERVRAYELLGLSSFFLDREDHARRYFEQLIRFRPDKRLDPVVVPPPAVAFFDQIHASLAQELKLRAALLRQKQREAEELQRRENVREIIVERTHTSRLVAAMPFGMGQFQNDQPLLGSVFLGSELVAIGLSVGFYMAVEDLRLPASEPGILRDGRFAHEDIDRARSLQTAHLVTGGVAVALMVTGILHGVLSFRDGIETRRTSAEPGLKGGPSGLSFSF